MDTEIRRHSVTANDVGNKFGASVIQWIINPGPVQRTGLPAYWSQARDYYLRQILYSEFHDFWAGAIGIAITKMASLSFELESSQPRIRNYFHDLLLAADDNQSWGRFLARHLQDFLCTDNGAFIEIVRASDAGGSRILGLMHLDSLRCTRTGDPETPILYRDTKGITHEVQAHQVLMFSDMPSATETYHGVGLCATSRAWGAIKKMEAVERYIYEKISGDRALALDLLGGVLEKDVVTGVEAAKEQNEARGNTSYLGAVMIPVPSDVPLSHVRINFAELPDGFDYDKQINNCILTFANSIGLDVQDLQPLTGRPLGTGTQSEVLQDKSSGKGLSAWRQQFTHMQNQFVLPSSVTFAFSEKDLRDQQRQADINKTVTDTIALAVEKIGLSAAQGQQLLADNDVIPQEFVPQDTTPREAIADTEKPEVEQAAQDVEPQTTPEGATIAQKYNEHHDESGRFASSGGRGQGGASYADAIAEDTPKRYASVVNSQPIVYRGVSRGKADSSGHVFVTNDRTLAEFHAGTGGHVYVSKVKKGGILYPDPEIEGEKGRRLTGSESLRNGSAVIHHSNLEPVFDYSKSDASAAAKEGHGAEPKPFRIEEYRQRFEELSH